MEIKRENKDMRIEETIDRIAEIIRQFPAEKQKELVDKYSKN